jgi:hypothetical protein
MTIKSPLEWFQEKFCSRCKNKKCEKKSTTIYTTTVDYNGKVFCALAALMLLELDRPALKEFGKQ